MTSPSPSEQWWISANTWFAYEKEYAAWLLLEMIIHEKIISLTYQTHTGNDVDDIEVQYNDWSIHRYQAKKNWNLPTWWFGNPNVKELLDSILNQYIKDLPNSVKNRYIIVSASNIPAIKELETKIKLKTKTSGSYTNLEELKDEIQSGVIVDWINSKITQVPTNQHKTNFGEEAEINDHTNISIWYWYDANNILQMLLQLEHISRDTKTLYNNEDKKILLKNKWYSREYEEIIKLILWSLVHDRLSIPIDKEAMNKLCSNASL